MIVSFSPTVSEENCTNSWETWSKSLIPRDLNFAIFKNDETYSLKVTAFELNLRKNNVCFSTGLLTKESIFLT